MSHSRFSLLGYNDPPSTPQGFDLVYNRVSALSPKLIVLVQVVQNGEQGMASEFAW